MFGKMSAAAAAILLYVGKDGNTSTEADCVITSTAYNN